MIMIFRFFSVRGFATLIGLIALALFIWFIGPLFSFAGKAPLGPASHRIYFICALLLIWLGIRLWRFIQEKRKDRQLLEGMA